MSTLPNDVKEFDECAKMSCESSLNMDTANFGKGNLKMQKRLSDEDLANFDSQTVDYMMDMFLSNNKLEKYDDTHSKVF